MLRECDMRAVGCHLPVCMSDTFTTIPKSQSTSGNKYSLVTSHSKMADSHISILLVQNRSSYSTNAIVIPDDVHRWRSLGALSLLSSAGWEISAVVLCSWRVKVGITHSISGCTCVWLAGKPV